jgi:hypothetical protein
LKSVIAKYPKANGWKKKEAFLFEFEIKASSICFKATTYRPKGLVDYSAYDEKLNDILKSTDSSVKKYNHWYVYESKIWDWNIRYKHRNWSTDTDEQLDKIMLEAEKIVNQLERKLLNHQEELQALKNKITS